MEQRICLGIGIVGKGFLCVAAKADMFVFIMDAGTEIWGAVFSFCRITWGLLLWGDLIRLGLLRMSTRLHSLHRE